MKEKGNKQESQNDKRRHPRIETSNFVTYYCIDEDGNEVAEGFGTAKDLSQGGLKLETQESVDTPFILIMVIDLEDEILEIKGKVVYSTEAEKGNFFSGIRFVDTEEKQKRAVKTFVKTYLMEKARKKPPKKESPPPHNP
jgi:c-di-GMP-binding flagellar brake protein YcgR